MTRRILITGGSGFVGQWLCRAMLKQDWTIYAGTLDGPPRNAVLSAAELAAVHWMPIDVTSEDQIGRALSESAPDVVVHLAGIASPPEANASPIRTFDVNALGAMRLLNVISHSPHSGARVIVVGSAEQYGAHPEAERPLCETAALYPLSAYAASKASQELIALQIFRGTGLDVVCTRSFNHSGVGHGGNYLLPALVRRARELPKSGGVLRIGSGTPVRDYLHVADAVNAYILLVQRGVGGEVYNVCSGQGVTVRELAERVLIRAGITADIVSDPALVRPVDVPILVGDNAKLRQATGWSPERTIDDIIDDMLHAATR